MVPTETVNEHHRQPDPGVLCSSRKGLARALQLYKTCYVTRTCALPKLKVLLSSE